MMLVHTPCAQHEPLLITLKIGHDDLGALCSPLAAAQSRGTEMHTLLVSQQH